MEALNKTQGTTTSKGVISSREESLAVPFVSKSVLEDSTSIGLVGFRGAHDLMFLVYCGQVFFHAR